MTVLDFSGEGNITQKADKTDNAGVDPATVRLHD